MGLNHLLSSELVRYDLWSYVLLGHRLYNKIGSKELKNKAFCELTLTLDLFSPLLALTLL